MVGKQAQTFGRLLFSFLTAHSPAKLFPFLHIGAPIASKALGGRRRWMKRERVEEEEAGTEMEGDVGETDLVCVEPTTPGGLKDRGGRDPIDRQQSRGSRRGKLQRSIGISTLSNEGNRTAGKEGKGGSGSQPRPGGLRGEGRVGRRTARAMVLVRWL